MAINTRTDTATGPDAERQRPVYERPDSKEFAWFRGQLVWKQGAGGGGRCVLPYVGGKDGAGFTQPTLCNRLRYSKFLKDVRR